MARWSGHLSDGGTLIFTWVTERRMRLFYVDESGNTGADLSSAIEPIHWLCAVGATPAAVHAIEAEMLGISIKYFRNRGGEADFELHGSEIFSGRGDCRALTVAQRVSLYGEVMALVPRHACHIWVRGIDKALHQQRAARKGYTPDHPHKLGFMYLVESIDAWMEMQQTDPLLFGATPQPIYGLLVADTQEEVRRDLVGRFAHWRRVWHRSRLPDEGHQVPNRYRALGPLRG